MLKKTKKNAKISELPKKAILARRIAERVRLIREFRGYSQKELAESAQITPSCISFLESAYKDQSQNINMIRNIAHALGVSIDFLVGDTDEFGGIKIARKEVYENFISRV